MGTEVLSLQESNLSPEIIKQNVYHTIIYKLSDFNN